MPTSTGSLHDRGSALSRDAGDVLGGFRDRFLIPDPDVIYLDGNSLGRMPRSTPGRVTDVMEREWAADLIHSWRTTWRSRPVEVGDLIGGQLLGARQGEVIVSDSTTVNLYKLIVAALGARPGRDVIVTDRDNFSTDRHVVEGIATASGRTVRWLDTTTVDGPQLADVAAALDDRVAVLTLSHVAYRTAAIADMAAITAAAHEAGALVLWDLSHAAGAVPIDLTGSGTDLAVGCTYKYLNGGPGSQAFLYVRRELQAGLRQPIWGWWGQHDMFDMTRESFDPAADIRAQLTGTAAILSLAAIEEGVRIIVDAGMPRLRAKGVALTEYAITLFDAWLAPLGFGLDSPRDSARRGSHVALRQRDAEALNAELARRKIVCGFRQPDGIRIGLAPLTTRFVDVYDVFTVLAELAAAGA